MTKSEIEKRAEQYHYSEFFALKPSELEKKAFIAAGIEITNEQINEVLAFIEANKPHSNMSTSNYHSGVIDGYNQVRRFVESLKL